MSPAAAYSLPSAAAHALLHALWQGALLAVIAAVAFSLLDPQRAAARHAIGLACLVAAAIAPIATFVIYHRGGGPGGGLGATAPAPPLLRPSHWIVVAVPLGWLLGATAMLVRQLGGWALVIALTRRPSQAPPSSWLRRASALREALGIGRIVGLRAAPGTGSPFTARALRPVIWLPAPLWSRLPLAQQDALLAHELAHVRRLDWVWNGLQRLVEAVVFFHPAVWWLGRQVRQEREHACDDLAVAACGDALALAEALATLARQPSAGPELVLAAHGGAVLQRITRLLGPPARAAFRVPVALVLLLGCSAALASQLRLATDVLIDVRVDASTEGPLTPGAFRELTADAFATRRHYRSTMDAAGRIVEVYEEDGQPRPIDPSVRTWLNELTSTVGWR